MVLFSISECTCISRKSPATAMVLEWSRADTGVGLSMPREVMGEGQNGQICRLWLKEVWLKKNYDWGWV